MVLVIAVLGVDGAVDHFDNLLGLAGALLAHDNSNHVYHSLEYFDDGTVFHFMVTLYHITEFFSTEI